ncbi:hypothetical protein ONZ45_g12011 [Pleurotus djamor]|nr:hypothetical protein ONZ45_g12011 [Pleurotus djamor]
MTSTLRRTFSSSLAITLLAALAINFLAVCIQFYTIFKPEEQYSYMESDHPRELLAEVQRVNMPFHDDPTYYGLNGANSSAEWESLLPQGGGIVFLGGKQVPYDISMWHQLRCLNYIRRTLIGEDIDYTRTSHCFHYLRQAILCSADLTLEPLPGGTTHLSDLDERKDPQVPVVHTCRDWRHIYDATDEWSASRPSHQAQ